MYLDCWVSQQWPHPRSHVPWEWLLVVSNRGRMIIMMLIIWWYRWWCFRYCGSNDDDDDDFSDGDNNNDNYDAITIIMIFIRIDLSFQVLNWIYICIDIYAYNGQIWQYVYCTRILTCSIVGDFQNIMWSWDSSIDKLSSPFYKNMCVNMWIHIIGALWLNKM
jgi:hypothetical protein